MTRKEASEKTATKKKSVSSRSKSPKKGRSKSPKRNHPTYEHMIVTAIGNLKERGGSSNPAIAKYILSEFDDLPEEATFKRNLSTGIKKAEDNGVIERVRMSYKLTAKGKKLFNESNEESSSEEKSKKETKRRSRSPVKKAKKSTGSSRSRSPSKKKDTKKTEKKETKKTRSKSPKRGRSKSPKRNHPPYEQMVIKCIGDIKDRTGSSLQAILKYMGEEFEDLPDEAAVRRYTKAALKKGEENENFVKVKSSYKLSENGKKLYKEILKAEKEAKKSRSRSPAKSSSKTKSSSKSKGSSKSKTSSSKSKTSPSRGKKTAKTAKKATKAASSKTSAKNKSSSSKTAAKKAAATKEAKKPEHVSNGAYHTRKFANQTETKPKIRRRRV